VRLPGGETHVFEQSWDKPHLERHRACDPRGAPLCGRADDAQLNCAVIAPA